ncbi:MAG: energy-coupling factor transporter transmembrane protein EcfT [Oscillospiraceae bacterium]|nr:energy-coupling factor transporter transmembrane protein EcfT [Oscillospiraceae bacterium]
MKYDAFSKCHPLVNFLFFVGAIGMSVVIQHPAYLLAGAVTGGIYYLLLNGKKGWKIIAGLLPMFVILTVINPLFNTLGETRLFDLFGRPYTLEALLYGAALASMFVIMMLWFGCYNKVLTSDKFTSLFGNVIPSVSLLLVMVFRMVPNFIRKTRQIIGARKSVGKGAGEAATRREKLSDGMTVVGALTGWALEGSIVTGDSMRARGYGAAKRSSFMIYRMTLTDWTLLAVIAVLFALTVTAAGFGQMTAVFVPDVELAPASWGLAAYTCYLLIPTVLHIKENVQWHISRSKI